MEKTIQISNATVVRVVGRLCGRTVKQKDRESSQKGKQERKEIQKRRFQKASRQVMLGCLAVNKPMRLPLKQTYLICLRAISVLVALSLSWPTAHVVPPPRITSPGSPRGKITSIISSGLINWTTSFRSLSLSIPALSPEPFFTYSTSLLLLHFSQLTFFNFTLNFKGVYVYLACF